jgi:hypothetical protein
MRLRVNEVRNKYMEVTTRPTGQKVFKVMNYESDCVKEFKYPGTQVRNSKRITAEINHRIGTANRCYHEIYV